MTGRLEVIPVGDGALENTPPTRLALALLPTVRCDPYTTALQASMADEQCHSRNSRGRIAGIDIYPVTELYNVCVNQKAVPRVSNVE